MARSKNEPLKTDGGVYHSQKDAIKKWEEKTQQEQIKVRVPAGAHKLITDYVKEQAAKDPQNPKYNVHNGKSWRPSVNALIRALLEEELGCSLDSDPEE